MENSKSIHKLEKLKSFAKDEQSKRDIQNKIDTLKGDKTVQK